MVFIVLVERHCSELIGIHRYPYAVALAALVEFALIEPAVLEFIPFYKMS